MAHRPPSAGAFATKLRAVTEGELTLLRKSREVFHTHTNYLLPLLIMCLLPVPALLILLRRLARFAFAAKLAPAWFLFSGVGLIGVALVLFAVQLYKVACLLVIEGARESGQGRHGDDHDQAEAVRKSISSPGGWPGILEAYAAAAAA